MGAERPQGRHDGSGSWHPAMRPDSYKGRSEKAMPPPLGEEIEATGISDEPQQHMIPSNTIIPDKPLDFEGRDGESKADPQLDAQDRNVYVAPQTNGTLEGSHTQRMDPGPTSHDFVLSPTTERAPVDGRSPEQHHIIQNQEIEPDSEAVHDPEALNVIPAQEKHLGDVTEPSAGAQEKIDVPVEHATDSKARKEMDIAFNSVLDDEGHPAPVTDDPKARQEMNNAFKLEPEHEETDYASMFQRTTSFPEVPPLHQSTTSRAHALPKSQAENIIEEDEALDQRQASFDDYPAQQNASNLTSNDDEGEFFANMGSVPPGPASPLPMDEELRYEEGLPLVPSEHIRKDTQPEPPRSDDFYMEMSQAGPGDEDAGFFENPALAAEDSSSFPPPPLDRKTTTQVLDSLHLAPHGVSHAPPEKAPEQVPNDVHEVKPSPTNLIGGGVAVSAHTVESQVLSQEQLHPEHQLHPVAPGANGDDLAEMWKAALGDDELLEDNETSLDPSALFGDEDGFLDDLAGGDETKSEEPFSPPLEAVYNSDGSMQGFGKVGQNSMSGESRYVPTGAASQTQQGHPSAYQPHQYPGAPSPQSTQGMTGLKNSISTPLGFGAVGVAAQQPYGSQAPPRPQIPASTQSFADKSKGGYTSPYDLPMDVTRPKKRNYVPQNAPTNQSPQDQHARPPPPRSSSMFTGAPPPQPQPPLPTIPRSGFMAGANVKPPSLKASPSTASFFEELAPKPRPTTSGGKYTPPVPHQQAQPLPPVAPSMSRQASIDQYTQNASTAAPQAYQLRHPEKMSLFGNTPLQQPPGQAVPAINSRYSPAPPQPSSVPPPRNRYASSPMGGSQPSSQNLPFQPRTSSPLAQSSQPRQSTYNADQALGRSSSDYQQQPVISRPAAPQAPLPSHQQRPGVGPSAEQLRGASPPLVNSRYTPLNDSSSSGSQAINTPSTDRLSSDGPPNHQSPHEPFGESFGAQPRMPPQRSQTQSPGAPRVTQEISPSQNPYQRPASVSERTASVSAYAPHTAVPQQVGRVRGLSQAINYVRPTDGREMDPLERWKGCPIVAFGFGGNVVTSFPVQIPRYAAGQKTPMIKCSPGEPKIRGEKFFHLDEGGIATFPGPLKAKSKKKEVLEWLQKRITDFEINAMPIANSGILPDPSKCHEEKVLLWKIVKVLVEHDGIVDGNQAAEQAVRAILSPELTQGDAVPLSLVGLGAATSGIVRRGGSTSVPEAVDQNAMEELRKTLLHGEREKAVWSAVDNRMWAHAMLISSTLDPKIWRQVSSEFVKQEVKSFGENTESLSALYQIFSGNGEESMDELVPPSARAGLQMVSKAASSGPTKNALDGLDRWRETLTLILSNRTPEDGRALISLGQLLAGYGRTEAAHICYIFAKSPGLFGGPDDPQVSVALLGSDHLRQPFNYGRDMDSILLTEAYDFARTVLASSSAATMSPHLQSYKLYHAMVLAEYGYKTEAQQYCDAITSALKSTTKLSPYYHPLLFTALENLTERLRQAPKDGSSSWISKPSIDKVSGSIWAKFNSYVAGDESDAASTGSGMPNEAESGPFGRVAGESPIISRSPSVADLYGSQPSGLGLASGPLPVTQPVNSRYAPAGHYTPRSSQEQPRQPSHEPQRQDALKPSYTPQIYSSSPASSNGPMMEPHKSGYQPASYAPQQENYLPTPPTQPEYLPEAPLDQPLYGGYQPTPSQERPPTELHKQSFVSQPPDQYGARSDYDASPSSHQSPPINSYEPPSYNPPSYDPGIPLTDSPTEEKPKKRDIVDDDDDDFEARAAAMRKKEERAKKDREADELMRKAAEEDAKKDHPKLNSKKSGWFGGWLGGSKEKAESMQQQGNAPIKVKLGEESSFYFDKEKGKWVNKKAGPGDEKASAPPPPPPKGPPSRAPSGAGGPPPSMTGTPPVPPMPTGMPTPPINLTRPPMASNPASAYGSRSATPAIGEGGETLAAPAMSRVASGGASSSGPPSGPPSAPPSRPATSQGGGAGGLDDLIGAPQQRKSGTVRGKPKRKGYVDVMAK